MKLKFENMTKAQKRVAIAKDALKQLKAKRYNLTYDDYAKSGVPINQSSLKQPNIMCECCQAGAATLSAVRLGNKWNDGSRFMDGGDVLKVLGRYFSQRQILSIEAAFMITKFPVMADYTDLSETPFTKACDFGAREFDMKTRFRAIFQNIIDNKGTFKP